MKKQGCPAPVLDQGGSRRWRGIRSGTLIACSEEPNFGIMGRSCSAQISLFKFFRWPFHLPRSTALPRPFIISIPSSLHPRLATPRPWFSPPTSVMNFQNGNEHAFDSSSFISNEPFVRVVNGGYPKSYAVPVQSGVHEAQYTHPSPRDTYADYAWPSSVLPMLDNSSSYYGSYPPYQDPLCSPMRELQYPCAEALPLHAPIPSAQFTGFTGFGGSVPGYQLPTPPLTSASTSQYSEDNKFQLSIVSPDAVEPCSPEDSPDSPAFPPTDLSSGTFPTPSDLLTDIAAHAADVAAKIEPETATLSERKVETVRRARQRIIADNIGFMPTDPDTISSHEKKRQYLDCLEQYVQFLQEQYGLLSGEPMRMERISTYRGMNSRSIRTLLVHMQDRVRQRHESLMDQERIFLDLRARLMAHEATATATAGFAIEHHSTL